MNTLRGILISAVLVLVCWWALQGSPSFQTCIQQDDKQSSENTSKDYVSAFTTRANAYRDCLGDFVRDRKEETLVVFTVVLAFSTIFLWVATRDLVKSAERTSRQQLRAYVTANSGDFTTKSGFVASVIVKNVGQTPAYNLTVISTTRVLAHPLPKRFNFKIRDEENPSSMTLGRDEAARHPSPLKEVITQTDFDNFAFPTGANRLYTYGTITYDDIFRKRHRTHFCNYIEWGKTEAFSTVSEQHNHAT